jgi:membrane-associated phospholipid phosphatase
MPDGFYGLHDAWHSRFQSFPSGHAAAVFGTAISLLFTCRWLGWLATIYALSVVWARMELYRHYPSDVLVGTLIGIVCGYLIGRGATTPKSPKLP